MKMKKNVLLIASVLFIVLASILTLTWAQDNNRPPMPPPGPPGGGPHHFSPTTEQMDANQDGQVTLEEHIVAWNKFSSERFKKLDADGNGQISEKEMPKMPGPGGPKGDRGPRGDQAGQDMGMPPPPEDGSDRPAQPRGPRGPMPPLPEQIDANQDGNISLEEHQAAWKKFGETQFKWADEDSNSILSKDELTKLDNPRPGPRPGGPDNVQNR